MNYQRLILVGNATDDPERLTSKKGNVAYTTFSVGVGDRKDTTTFFPVIVFGKLGEAVAEFVAKGRQVLVDGRIQVSDRGRFRVGAESGFGGGLTGYHCRRLKGTSQCCAAAGVTWSAVRGCGMAVLMPRSGAAPSEARR